MSLETRDIAWYKAKAKEINNNFDECWSVLQVGKEEKMRLIHRYRQVYKAEKIKELLSYKGLWYA